MHFNALSLSFIPFSTPEFSQMQAEFRGQGGEQLIYWHHTNPTCSSYMSNKFISEFASGKLSDLNQGSLDSKFKALSTELKRQLHRSI